MTVTPARFRQLALGAFVALVVVIVAGAAVRLTDSGLGCDDWPNCSSTRLVDVSSKHAAIEQVNRLFNGVVTIMVVLVAVGAHRVVPRRDDLIRLAWWLVALVAANAVLGGISVKVDLHPLAIQGHLLLAMAAIVAATTLVQRAGEPAAATRRRVVTPTTDRMVAAHFVATWLAVFTGTLVTGAGPHAGDVSAERLDIAIPTVARAHGVTMIATLTLAIALAWRIRSRADERAALQSPLAVWIALGVAQAALGYVQYLADVPELLVGIHVAGATAVMWTATRVLLATRAV